MIDQVSITVKGGHGGPGGLAFSKIPGLTNPPPEGGNGGNGGTVYFEATSERNTLLDYRFQKNFKAADGENGNVNNRHGHNGGDLILKIPAGTQVYWLGRLIEDLDVPGKRLLVAKGGRGGRGNIHLRTKEDRRPHWSEPGEEGEYKEVSLSLKLLADVGLIGLPNAGKSTLLSKLTAAQPKIGAYPFTTIDPNLGVMHWKKRTVVLADVPGLIEGAAAGKGLGHQFLRHLERTKVLVHLTSSLEDYWIVKKELKEFDANLYSKVEIIVLSRADTLAKEEQHKIIDEFKKAKLTIFPVSALNGEGLDKLQNKIIQNLS